MDVSLLFQSNMAGIFKSGKSMAERGKLSDLPIVSKRLPLTVAIPLAEAAAALDAMLFDLCAFSQLMKRRAGTGVDNAGTRLEDELPS
jgi:hypothetical protein